MELSVSYYVWKVAATVCCHGGRKSIKTQCTFCFAFFFHVPALLLLVCSPFCVQVLHALVLNAWQVSMFQGWQLLGMNSRESPLRTPEGESDWSRQTWPSVQQVPCGSHCHRRKNDSSLIPWWGAVHSAHLSRTPLLCTQTERPSYCVNRFSSAVAG